MKKSLIFKPDTTQTNYPMKNKYKIYILLLIAISTGLWFWLEVPSSKPSNHIIKKNRALSKTPKKNSKAHKINVLKLDDDGVLKPEGVSDADWRRAVRIHSIKKSANRKLAFYGQIVDQKGIPVEGVDLEIRLIGWQTEFIKYLATGKTQEKKILKMLTDSNGVFNVEKEMGTGLRIEKMRKEGYSRAQRGTQYSFSYSNLSSGSNSSMYHHPDKNKPVVFTMWKKGKAEPLILREMRYSFHNGKEPKTMFFKFDVRSNPTPNPIQKWDVKVEAHKSSNEKWVLTITANGDGGFLVTDDVFSNTAPKLGYTSKLSYSFDSSNRPVHTPHLKHYYKADKGNKYASFALEYGDYYKGQSFFVRFRQLKINPNASRNLEYDKSKRIKSR